MNWQASLSWEDAKARAQVISTIRAFFADRDVVEVETPLLSQGTITDLHLDAFASRYRFLPEGEVELYLQTSPEFAMKRLLASGYQSIFQICKAFRDEPFGHHHNPEFTMLEWYRIGFDHHELMKEVDELLMSILNVETASMMTYQSAFKTYTSIDPLDTDLDALKAFLELHSKLDDWLLKTENLDTLLQFIFAEFIEVHIGKDKPCFIYDFPASQASLAKLNPQDNRVAERFECYFKGIELANGFHELTNADEQRDRFYHDNQLRNSEGLKEKPIDERLITALSHGLPDCAGVALGIDRLIMLALDKCDIEQVLTFNIRKA